MRFPWVSRKAREECPRCHAMVDPNKRFGLQYHRERHLEDPFHDLFPLDRGSLTGKTCCGLCGTWRNPDRNRGLPHHPVQAHKA